MEGQHGVVVSEVDAGSLEEDSTQERARTEHAIGSMIEDNPSHSHQEAKEIHS